MKMPRIYYTLFVYDRLFNKFVHRDCSNLLIATQSIQPPTEDIIIYKGMGQWKNKSSLLMLGMVRSKSNPNLLTPSLPPYLGVNFRKLHSVQ